MTTSDLIFIGIILVLSISSTEPVDAAYFANYFCTLITKSYLVPGLAESVPAESDDGARWERREGKLHEYLQTLIQALAYLQ